MWPRLKAVLDASSMQEDVKKRVIDFIDCDDILKVLIINSQSQMTAREEDGHWTVQVGLREFRFCSQGKCVFSGTRLH